MSKKRDYTKFSKPETTENVVETVDEVVANEHKPVIGIVTDCVKLNVREDPAPTATIVGTIGAETELVVDMAESTDDFYKVITSAGIEGYCMKRFITIMP